MLKIAFLLIFCLFVSAIYAQMAARLGSARSLAMGQYVCFGQDAEALATNPAMLPTSERWGGYLQAQERYGTGAFRTVWAGVFYLCGNGRS